MLTAYSWTQHLKFIKIKKKQTILWNPRFLFLSKEDSIPYAIPEYEKNNYYSLVHRKFRYLLKFFMTLLISHIIITYLNLLATALIVKLPINFTHKELHVVKTKPLVVFILY